MDLVHVLTIANSFLGIFFLLLAYTYINKLEKIGCACAEMKNRKFLKNFALFGAVYLFVTMMISPSAAVAMFGETGSFVYWGISLLFVLFSLVFYVLALLYVRKLIKEKCECSEDVRREVLYIYSIVEIVLISIALVNGVLLSLLGSAIGLALATFNNVDHTSVDVIESIRNPIKSLRKAPADFNKVTSSLKNTLRGRK